MAQKKDRKRRAGDSRQDEVAETTQRSDATPPHIYALWFVLAFSLISRLYFLYYTADQAVWWDEANYLVKAKSLALGTPETGYDPGRPILFSILMAPFFYLGTGEFGIRLTVALASFLSVYLVYRIGARLFDPWVGVIAAAMFSCHYLTLLYTVRIMCEIPYITTALLGIDFLLSNHRPRVWAAGPILAITVMLRYPAAAIPVCLLLYILVTERSRALRKADYWISAGLAALMVAPDLLLRGSSTMGAVSWLMAPQTMAQRFDRLGIAIKIFFGTFDWLSQIALLAGLCIAAWSIATWKSRPPAQPRPYLLLVLWLSSMVLIQGLFFVHLEDRYLYASMPAAFLLIASAFWHLARNCPTTYKPAATALTGLAVLGICGASFAFSKSKIAERRGTFSELKTAGEWIKLHQEDNSVVISASVAQLTYYSEKPGNVYPATKEAFHALVASGELKHAVISTYEPHPDWINTLDVTATGLAIVLSSPATNPKVQILQPIPPDAAGERERSKTCALDVAQIHTHVGEGQARAKSLTRPLQ